MAITAITPITGLRLSRNRIELNLSTNSLLVSGGITRQILFAIDANPTNGDTLQLIWTSEGESYNVTLTWATTPDGSENQIALLVGGTMVNYLTNTFKVAVDLHPILSDFWEVTNISTGGFWLSAKNFGYTDVAVNVSGAFLHDGEIGPFDYPVIAAEVPIVLRDDLHLLAKFYVEQEWNSGEFELVAETSFKPAPNNDYVGIVYVDISHFFEPFLRWLNPDPSEDVMSAIQLIRSINKRCRIDIWEYYDTAKQGKAYRSAIFRVINGGLAEVEFDQWTPFANNWSTIDLRCLTLRPNEREVTEGMSHHLFWLCGRLRGLMPSMDPELYYLRAKVYWTDGTTSTSTIASDTEIKQFDTVKLRAGFEHNNLQALQPDKTAYKYEIWMTAQADGEVLFAPITYYLKPKHYLERFITWTNAFGCTEVLRMFGESKLLAEVTREFAEKAPPLTGEYSYMTEFITRMAHSKKLSASITLESGPMSAEELAAHTDMVNNSPIVWLHVLPNAAMTPTMLPMILKPGSFETGYKNVEGQYINGIQLTLEFMDTRNWSNTYKLW